MDKLQQMAERHAVERARLEREMQIAALMPIAPDACQATKTGADWVNYRARTMGEALAIFRAFNVLPVYYASGTFGHIEPESLLKPDVTIKGGPYAAWLSVEKGERFGPTADLHFYTEIDGKPYRINIGIKGPDYIGACNRFAPTMDERRGGSAGRGRVISRTYGANALLNGLADKVVSWNRGSGPLQTGASHTYLICADDDATMPGAEQSHACGQLQNIADALEPRPAD